MSMQTMQDMLWRAMSDEAFRTMLLDAPHETLRKLALSEDELSLLTDTPASSLVDLAGRVEAWRRGDPIPATAPAPTASLALAS